MKAKFLLPLMFGLSAAMWVGCSSDSNGLSPVDTNSSSSEVTDDEKGDVSSSSVKEDGGKSSDSKDTKDSSSSISEDDEVSSSSDEGGLSSSSQKELTPSEPMDPVKVEIPNTFAKNESTPVENFANYNYYGAELSGVDQFTYGRFEARMKMVSIPGSVSSMFLYYDDSWKKEDEPWNEIDIEVLGKNKGEWQSNLITRVPDVDGEKPHNNITSEYVTGFGFDATEDFHLYAIIWTPEYISWEIDSVEVRRDVVGMDRPAKVKHDQVAFMTEQQSIRFNLWASKSKAWVGEFTGAELAGGPQTQWIDYVRVYSYDESTKTFKKEWQDDFDGSDLSDHWTAGNWEMEHVMLSKSNVVVEGGYCKLLMTREAK